MKIITFLTRAFRSLRLGARNSLRGACAMNPSERQRRERIKKWLKAEVKAERPLCNFEDLLYRFEVYLGECETKRQAA